MCSFEGSDYGILTVGATMFYLPFAVTGCSHGRENQRTRSSMLTIVKWNALKTVSVRTLIEASGTIKSLGTKFIPFHNKLWIVFRADDLCKSTLSRCVDYCSHTALLASGTSF